MGKPWNNDDGSAIDMNLFTLLGVILAMRWRDYLPTCRGKPAGLAASCVLAAAIVHITFEATVLLTEFLCARWYALASADAQRPRPQSSRTQGPSRRGHTGTVFLTFGAA